MLEAYGLAAHELRVLESACVCLDSAVRLEERVAEDGLMVAGSKGQDVLHPAVVEARQQRLALGRLLAQLALPDPEGGQLRTVNQVRAREAAQARWRAQRRDKASRGAG